MHPTQENLDQQGAEDLPADSTGAVPGQGAGHELLLASFMPKPFAELTGSGCHTHLSLWGAAGSANPNQNPFHDPSGELGLSALAYHFLAGLLAHAPAVCCLSNPTANSYRQAMVRWNAQPHWS